MKTTLRNSSLRFGLFAISASVMLLFSGCSQEETVVPENDGQNLTQENTRASGPSASGHGTVTFDGIPIAGEGFRQFTFHARVKNNGSVDGNGVLTYTGGVRKVHFDIDCLVVNGNEAIMSGLITKDKQFPANVGLNGYFKVIDNGEGANAAPDQITLYFSSSNPLLNCSTDFGYAFYDIEGGNVQVKE